MTPEAPTPSPREVAQDLINQALEFSQQGLEQEILFHSRIFDSSVPLTPRFRLQKPADSAMADLIDDLLKVDDRSAVSYESGMNQAEGYRYTQWVTPSRQHPGLFTLNETVTRRRVRLAERSAILVSKTNLLEHRDWSRFFYDVIQKEA